MPSINPFSSISGPTSVASIPMTHCSAKLLADAASNEMDSSTLWAATGKTIREVAKEKSDLSDADLDRLLDAGSMTEPGLGSGGGGG